MANSINLQEGESMNLNEWTKEMKIRSAAMIFYHEKAGIDPASGPWVDMKKMVDIIELMTRELEITKAGPETTDQLVPTCEHCLERAVSAEEILKNAEGIVSQSVN